MRLRAPHGIAMLAAATALCALLAGDARAGGSGADAVALAAEWAASRSRAAAEASPNIPRVDPLAFGLGRAVAEWRAGNPRGVIENLERIDFASAARIAEADRAAFLLGHAYLNLGDIAAFTALAHKVAAWNVVSPYTGWLAFQRELVEAAQVPVLGAAGSAGPSVLTTYRAALALEAQGGNADAEWARLAAGTGTALGRDLAGGALARAA